jgi:hypothetical protein
LVYVSRDIATDARVAEKVSNGCGSWGLIDYNVRVLLPCTALDSLQKLECYLLIGTTLKVQQLTTSAFFSKIVNLIPGTLIGSNAPAEIPLKPAPTTATYIR